MVRSIVLGLFVLVVCGNVRGQDQQFKPLFNGKDLDGWTNVNCAPDTWSVREGKVFCTGKPIGELRTTRMYQNFVLELEWRHLEPKGNAGVFVWADALTARGRPFIRAIEVQVLDGREGEGHTSDGDIFPIHGTTMKPINGRGGMRAFPTEKRSKPSPEWNHYRIECVDGNISLAVNGKVVTQGRECSLRKGYICLESEGSPVEFRNIRLQELPGPVLMDDQIAASDEGFKSLYNGVNLDGWKTNAGMTGHWESNDWRISYDGKASGDEKNLWTAESYKDFVLIVDWRWSGQYEATTKRPIVLPNGTTKRNPDGSEILIDVPVADSGIYLRGSSKAQINIWQWPVGSGEIWGYRTDESMPAEVRAAATPKKKADEKIGDWNRFEITMKEDRLSIVLNGETVIENCRLPGIPKEGPIALQHHGDPIEFANIFLRKL